MYWRFITTEIATTEYVVVAETEEEARAKFARGATLSFRDLGHDDPVIEHVEALDAPEPKDPCECMCGGEEGECWEQK